MKSAFFKSLLIIVAKAPVPGKVKTRLCTDLTAEAACDLYRCFLQDRVAEMSDLKNIDLSIAYTPRGSETHFAPFAAAGFDLFPQRGNHLGERLHNIFLQKWAQGFRSLVVIDSDSPDLPKSIVKKAFEWLKAGSADAVFGPCRDGGYYLVGLREPCPELFRNIPWSTSAVLQKTLEAAGKKGLKTKLLPPWNDLDTFEDLLGYYGKYRNCRPEGAWAGEKTFHHLSCLAEINRRSL